MSTHQTLPTSETDTVLSDVELVENAQEGVKPPMPAQQSLRFSGANQSTLVWKEIVKFVDDGTEDKKQILFGVSGVAKPGEMVALMGPSGSGDLPDSMTHSLT